AMTLERLGKRRGRRDRVPRAERRAAIDRGERRRVVAVDEYLVADRVGALDPDAARSFQMRQRVVPAHVKRVEIRLDQLVLALDLLGDALLDRLRVDVEQRRQRAD